MKKLFSLIFLALLPVVASAYDACVNGIFYNFWGDKATVTYDENEEGSLPGYSGKVVIPSSVTYNGKTYTVTEIDECAFAGCSGLTSVTIPNSVTGIGYAAFYNCSKLTSITIPEGVTYIDDDVFYGCSSLTSITIKGNVTVIDDGAFRECSKLTTIDLPGSLKYIGCQTFENCTSLTSIAIPESVTTIESSAFEGCVSLTSVNIPNKLEEINSEVFYGCRALTSINIPEGVPAIWYRAFGDCTSLTSVVIPSSLNYIEEYAFSNCASLTDVFCYAENVPSTKNNAFKDSPIATATLHVPVASLTAYRTTSPWNGFGSIVAVDAPISDNIYFHDANVKALCVANWDTDSDGELSEAEAAAVTSLGEVFKGNTAITSFDELWYFKGLASIGDNSFCGCSALTSVIIPDSVTSIGSAAFSYTGLTSVTISEKITSIGSDAFSYAGLTSIKIPTSITIIKSGVFRGCTNLTSITIPESVSAIESGAFEGCASLTKVTIPNKLEEIESDVFRGCCALTSVTLPNGIQRIGSQAFADCTGLTFLEIPISVTAIAARAFQNCSSLATVYCYAEDVPETGDDIFTNTPIDSAALYVPAGSVDSYKLAEPWSGFGNIAVLPIKINAENFPDARFRDYLLKQSYGKDGVLTNEEIADVTVISVKNSIVSLKGIEYFTALKELTCSSNNLAELDMSGCPALEKLNCYNNKLTSLNVSKNKLLKSLDCSWNSKLTKLDVSQNTELSSINCTHNIYLAELYLPKGPALTSLAARSTGLTKLDVSGCTGLPSLDCSSNKLTSLDVSGCTAMTSLKCTNNNLVELNLSNAPLTSLNCRYNNLTSIDLSTNTALNSFVCDNNQLTTLDVSANTALTSLDFSHNNLAGFDLSANTALTSLNCSHNPLVTFDVSENTALETLNCYNDQLTALDVSQNTELTTLRCGNNNLTAIDVSKNTKLKKLECNNNKLTRLDVSQCANLHELYCQRNQIKDAAMDALVESLPALTGDFFVISTEEDWPREQNVITTTQVAAANAKGWRTYSYVYAWDYDDLNRYTWEKYSGSRPTTVVAYTAGQMATIILPTKPDASKGRYYRLDRCEDNLIVFMEELQPQARTPYIIVPTEDFSIDFGAFDLSELSSDTVSIKGISFIGSYISKVLPAPTGEAGGGSSFYYDIIDITRDCLKAELSTEMSVVGALRAYLIVKWDDPIDHGGSKGEPSEKKGIIILNDGDGIRPTPAPSRNGGEIYDLSGRKIVNSKSSNSKLPKGLYIQNGKKFVK